MYEDNSKRKKLKQILQDQVNICTEKKYKCLLLHIVDKN